MERTYRAMYRLGLIPWDREQIPQQLTQRIEGGTALRPGVALDIGCGTGRHAAYLADHGWEVTGIDVAPQAIDQARSRSTRVHWAVADLTDESITRVKERLARTATLILDVGCLHGLSEAGRASWGDTVNTVAAPGASLLIWATRPGARLSIGPRGIESSQVADSLGPSWKLTSEPSPSHWAEYRLVKP